MAGLLAVFAEFERDILRERVKAGIAHARNGAPLLHSIKHRIGLMHHDARALGHDPKLGIGHELGDLEELAGVETRHLKVDPHERRGGHALEANTADFR